MHLPSNHCMHICHKVELCGSRIDQFMPIVMSKMIGRKISIFVGNNVWHSDDSYGFGSHVCLHRGKLDAYQSRCSRLLKLTLSLFFLLLLIHYKICKEFSKNHNLYFVLFLLVINLKLGFFLFFRKYKYCVLSKCYHFRRTKRHLFPARYNSDRNRSVWA